MTLNRRRFHTNPQRPAIDQSDWSTSNHVAVCVRLVDNAFVNDRLEGYNQFTLRLDMNHTETILL